MCRPVKSRSTVDRRETESTYCVHRQTKPSTDMRAWMSAMLNHSDQFEGNRVADQTGILADADSLCVCIHIHIN